ncbi:MAG: glutamine-hydrolyzing carbamoyl-phosphate synthase small subunit, partial [Ruminococcus sp.]|nr:glutamine-hydrolyzing carbamoyl-phosphate synthase small subunit [Ruminococcus sp.]
MSRAAYLVLENGTVFEGKAFGAEKETMGELVFTTAMTGYLETLTDPSYFGQVVLHTFPLIGNYGVIRSDFETPTPALNGYIVREWCQAPSNFRSEGDLDTFLKEKGVTGICGLDTRALTRIVREYGVMNCAIRYTPEVTDEILNELKGFVITEAVEKTTISEIENFPVENAKYHVVLMDFGAKHNIGRELNKRGCSLTVVPAGTAAEEVLALNPDGVMLSNGPGDPAKNAAVIAELKKLSDSGVPMFGICLGHQLLALAHGAKTEKLKYGHRGANQPVTDTETGRVYITSQNHGYAVVNDSLG